MTDNSPHSDPSRNLPVAASQAYGPSALVVGGGRHTAPPQPGEPESVPWARYADALRRHWWIVVLVTLLGIGVGFFLKRRALPEYRADATIWITRANNAQDRGPIRTEQLLGTSSWEGLVRSYGIIYPVIRRLSLNISFKSQADSALARAFSLDSTFQPGIYRLEVDTLGKTYSLSAEERGVVARGTVGDSIGRQQLGFIWSPPASLLTPRRVVEFSVTSLRATAQGLNSKLTTNIPGEDGQFMVLSLSGTNPRRVAATLNAWVREFVTTATALKKGKLGLQQDAMARQLAVVTQQLGTAETDLQRFRERNATLMPDNAATGGNPGFFQLQYQRDAVQRDRAALERILRAARDSAGGAVAPEAFLAVPGVLTGPGSAQLNAAISALTVAQSELEAARRSFTDSSDFVLKAVEKRDALAKVTIPGIVTEIIASLKNQEQGFSTQIDTMSRELRAVPARALDEQRLRRNYAQSEQLFMQMKAAYDQVRLTDLQTTPDLTIQDPAEAPLSPTSNPGNRLFILAVMASIAAGVGLALVRDRLDRHFRHPEQPPWNSGSLSSAPCRSSGPIAAVNSVSLRCRRWWSHSAHCG